MNQQPTPQENARPSRANRHTAHCGRCGFDWFPRVAEPVRCPDCGSTLWNTPRAQQLPGKPAPTRKGAPRGAQFTSTTAAKAVRQRKTHAGGRPTKESTE